MPPVRGAWPSSPLLNWSNQLLVTAFCCVEFGCACRWLYAGERWFWNTLCRHYSLIEQPSGGLEINLLLRAGWLFRRHTFRQGHQACGSKPTSLLYANCWICSADATWPHRISHRPWWGRQLSNLQSEGIPIEFLHVPCSFFLETHWVSPFRGQGRRSREVCRWISCVLLVVRITL